MPNPNFIEPGELELGVVDFGRLGRREVGGRCDGRKKELIVCDGHLVFAK